MIHVDDDEPKPSDTTNVTEEVKQAQREAKQDAERFVAEEERPDTNEKVFANNEADVVKEPGEGGGLYCPYIAINGRDDWIFKEVDEQTFQSRPPMMKSLLLLSSEM